MSHITLGEFKIFPGTQLVCHLEDGSEWYPKWGEVMGVSGKPKKLYCSSVTMRFYRSWKPCVIMTQTGFYGGITNGTTVLIYADSSFTPILFQEDVEYFKIYSESTGSSS
jgi:hypothetical protein